MKETSRKGARGAFWRIGFPGLASSLSGWEELDKKGHKTQNLRQEDKTVASEAADIVDIKTKVDILNPSH